MSNERAERWLRSLGYDPEPEPRWIEAGQKPDFFCAGNNPLWVEVKTLDPPVERQLLDRAFDDLRARCLREEGLVGDLYVCVGASYDERAARWLIRHLRRGPRSDTAINILTVPTDPDFSRALHFQYESTAGDVSQSSVAAESGKYPFYPALEPRNWSNKVVFRTKDGMEEEGPELYDFLESDDSLLAVRLCPSQEPLTVHGAIGPGFHKNSTTARIRAEVKDSNSQLRNGQKYCPAPGVCVIYHESLDFAGDRHVVAALFGDLIASIGADGRPGEAVHGRNGAWSARKNRGVSALRYIRTEQSVTTVINPWADVPIDVGLFRERVWKMENGRPVEQR
jgi:hypothetical protein